jgi:hypothetical protein
MLGEKKYLNKWLAEHWTKPLRLPQMANNTSQPLVETFLLTEVWDELRQTFEGRTRITTKN